MDDPKPSDDATQIAASSPKALSVDVEKQSDSLPEGASNPHISNHVTQEETIVGFSENDPENPLNWSLWYKWIMVALISTLSMLNSFATISIVPAAPLILEEFHVEDQLYSTLLVSIWELGEGLGPFLVGPLSELYGRLPVSHTGNGLFLLSLVACALSTNISMLVAFRFFSGFFIGSMTLGPAVIGDIFVKERRGSAMAIAICFPLVGPVAAPIFGSYTTQAKGWRWSVWILVIVVGFMTCLSVVTFRETYKVTILQRKARRLNKVDDNAPPQGRRRIRPLVKAFFRSMSRPLTMMLSSPVVFIVSLYTAITYGLSYLVLTTLTAILESRYGFAQGPVGLAFLARASGMIVGIVLYGTTSDRYFKYKKSIEGIAKPEHRLPLMLVGAIALPIGFFLYGWTANANVQWIVPLIGTALIGFSVILTILPTENYLVDSFDLRGASAIAAGVILRAISGAVLPLVGPPLYSKLGLGWGNSVLGFVAVAFIPVIGLLLKYGEYIAVRGRPDQS